MFCQNCGKQIEDESRFCPYCGVKNASEVEKKNQDIPDKKEKGVRKKKKLPIIIIAIGILFILGIVIFSGSDPSPSSEQLISLVQNGYLGNYDTVTIKEILGYTDEDAKWNAGEAVSGDYYIVEYKGESLTIQFSVNGLEEELFKVSGVEAVGMGTPEMEAYDVKVYLDGIYQLYANAHPEKGLYIDLSTSNNTLEGHIGPVKSVEDSVNALMPMEEVVEDLALYSDYTEDELIRELGYEKNEYGVYPEETHVNFYFMAGKMNMLMISKPEDMGMSLCGVGLQDSLEEAEAILESKGFVREGSFETAGLAGDGSLGTVDTSVISYIENGTGYPYYIYTDAGHNITSLSYGLEKEEPIFVEEQLEEESYTLTVESLTYGSYSFDDGTGTTGTAYVGFYSDGEGGDYIYIECWRNDREIALFEGRLEESGEGYYAYDDGIDTDIFVIFADGGFCLYVVDSNFTEAGSMEGFYVLEKALNLNEVG